jgi:hypothetical protein
VPDSSLELGSLLVAWRVLVGSNHANAHRRVELNSRTPARGAQWWARGWPRRAGCDNDVVPSRMSWAPFRRIGGDNVAGQTDEALEGRQFDLFSTCRVAGKGPDRPVTDLAAADRHRPALPTRPSGVGGQVAGSRSVRSARRGPAGQVGPSYRRTQGLTCCVDARTRWRRADVARAAERGLTTRAIHRRMRAQVVRQTLALLAQTDRAAQLARGGQRHGARSTV